MQQTVPFQVATGAAITPVAPFAHLYQHIRQRDPKLAETLDRLAAPASITNNLSNPIQALTAKFPAPSPGDTTDYANVLSNVPTDTTMYFPIIAYANIVTSSSTDVQVDILISHYDFVNNTNPLQFASILNGPLVIPATTNTLVSPIFNFGPNAYLMNLDIVYFQLISAAFDGALLTAELLFQ